MWEVRFAKGMKDHRSSCGHLDEPLNKSCPDCSVNRVQWRMPGQKLQ